MDQAKEQAKEQEQRSPVELEAHAFRLVALRLCLDAVAAERDKGIRGRIIHGFGGARFGWSATVRTARPC
jgi:hypothetical protein